jgi:hypothetical protein
MAVTRVMLVVALATSVILSGEPLGAQSLGSFSWQLQPFCNNLTVNVTQQGALFTVDGYDDQCGAPQRAPLAGVATQNPDGTIGFGLHIVTVPGGRGVDVDARISLGSLSGPWSDSAGNAGVFAFNARTAGSPRPLPTIPAAALTPGSVTAAQLAPAAVTTTNLADGSVTPQKLAVGLPKLSWSGLTSSTTIQNGATVIVRTVTMAIPAAGRVMVNASGLFDLLSSDVIVGNSVAQYIWCSISTGTAVEAAHYMYAQTLGPNYLRNVPFAGTRVYDVTAGTFKVNLVCTATDNDLDDPNSIQTAQLTALFVPS